MESTLPIRPSRAPSTVSGPPAPAASAPDSARSSRVSYGAPPIVSARPIVLTLVRGQSETDCATEGILRIAIG
jgi:hypothetical protein